MCMLCLIVTQDPIRIWITLHEKAATTAAFNPFVRNLPFMQRKLLLVFLYTSCPLPRAYINMLACPTLILGAPYSLFCRSSMNLLACSFCNQSSIASSESQDKV